MALKLSVGARNARLDALVAEIGASPVLKIRTGSAPADVATADSGTVLATLNLPSTAFNAASSGAVTKTGTWSDSSADNSGTAAHFRLYKSDGTTAVAQGTVTVTGGGGDLTVDSVTFNAGQAFSVSAFQITDGNA
jgi:hypothetical protein